MEISLFSFQRPCDRPRMKTAKEKIAHIAQGLVIPQGRMEMCLDQFTPSELEELYLALTLYPDGCEIPSKAFKLKHHQSAISKALLEGQRGIIVAFPMGSGKTLTAISAARCLQHQATLLGKEVKLLVITPTSLIDNYKAELTKAGYKPLPTDIIITKTKFFLSLKEGKFTDLSNYIVVYDEIHSLRTDYRCEFCGERAKIFFQYSPNTISETTLKATRSAWRVIGLTGTPVFNQPWDWVNLWAFATGETPLTLEEYTRLRFGEDSRAPELLHNIFAFYQMPRDEFPRREDRYHLIKMTGAYEAQYIRLEKKYRKSSKRAARGKKTRVGESPDEGEPGNAFMIRLRKGVNQIKGVDGKYLPSPKLKVAIDIITSAKGGVVFYSEFLSGGVNLLKNALSDLGISWLVISGTIPQKKRGPIVDAYNAKHIKVLLITKAGGEGLNLLETSDVIIFESGWVEAMEEQVVARGIRCGSHRCLAERDRVVKVHHLFLIFSEPKDQQFTEYLLKLRETPDGYWVKSKEDLPKPLGYGIDVIDAATQGSDVYLKWYSESKAVTNSEEIEFLKEYSLPV